MKTVKTSRRARELADIARSLEEKKSALPYGEFEKWALKAFPKYPIQVLRYLRKAQRIFGKDLARLLERLGQKKVFLLVGLEDPWAPIRDGISNGNGRGKLPLEQFSVSQLRSAIRVRLRTESQGKSDWGTLGAALDRVVVTWPRVQKQSPAAVHRDGVRNQLERFRAVLAEALGQLDQMLNGGAKPAVRKAERVAGRPRGKKESGFLD